MQDRSSQTFELLKVLPKQTSISEEDLIYNDLTFKCKVLAIKPSHVRNHPSRSLSASCLSLKVQALVLNKYMDQVSL